MLAMRLGELLKEQKEQIGKWIPIESPTGVEAFGVKEMKDTEDLRLARIYDRVFEVCYPMQFTGKSMRYETAAKRFDEMKNFFGLNS